MIDPLPRLLKSYEFLHVALTEHSDRMAANEIAELRKERDRTFAEIMSHASLDARVTVAQLRFILENLRELASDPGLLPAVERMSKRHLDRIVEKLQLCAPGEDYPRRTTAKAPSSRKSGLDPARFECFDLLSDRVSVIDRRCRYIFTNAANARFHGEAAGDFVGRPNWLVAGEAFFEQISRPRIKLCLEGYTQSCICRNPNSEGMILSATFEPAYDDLGKIAGVIIVSRDVTSLGIAEDKILSLRA